MSNVGIGGIEDGIKKILEVLIASEESETKSEYGEIIDSIINSGYNLKDPEDFSLLIGYQLEKVLGQVVLSINSSPEGIDSHKLIFLYLNHRFMENHVRSLITSREGSVCCADKTRWILEKYKNHILTGETVEMGEEIRFYTPGFGEFFDWVNYCDSLYHLFNGDPTEYAAAYTNLLKKESRIIV